MTSAGELTKVKVKSNAKKIYKFYYMHYNIFSIFYTDSSSVPNQMREKFKLSLLYILIYQIFYQHIWVAYATARGHFPLFS